MITANSPFSAVDQDAERRRVLAKVYGLLIKLAEENDSKSGLADATATDAEKIDEPTSLSEDPSKQ